MKLIADISHYQGTIDWNEAAKELEFCILRASVGVNRDREYAANVRGCKDNSVPYHAYHYLKAVDTEAARKEADTFAAAVGDSCPLFWVVDCECDDVETVEARRKGAATEIVAAFMERLREIAGSGIRIAAYIGHNSYDKWSLDLERLAFAYVWIPRYGSNSGVPEEGKEPKYPCDLWQYTSCGRIDGIPARVDLNALMGDKPLSFYTSGDVKNDVKGEVKEMLTNLELVDFCFRVYDAKWVYWYGTYGNKCTQSKYERKAAQYPEHYTAARKAGYMADIAAGATCADCVGMIKAFAWCSGVFGAVPAYGTNGCPDGSANSLFKLCKETGSIGSMPDIPGLAVWKDGHIGVYVGGGETIEMNGFAKDCIRRKVTEGTWTRWGKLPFLRYVSAKEELPEKTWQLGERPVADGCKGEDVRELQLMLMAAGYALPKYGADGECGAETTGAVKRFQADAGIAETGIADAETIKLLADHQAYEEQPPVNGEETPDAEPVRSFVLIIEGDEATLKAAQIQFGGRLAEFDSVSVL